MSYEQIGLLLQGDADAIDTRMFKRERRLLRLERRLRRLHKEAIRWQSASAERLRNALRLLARVR